LKFSCCDRLFYGEPNILEFLQKTLAQKVFFEKFREMYQIGPYIAKGMSGEVFQVTHKLNQKRFACKSLSKAEYSAQSKNQVS